MTQPVNPLFPDSPSPDNSTDKPAGYLVSGKANRIEPISDPASLRGTSDSDGANPAVALIKEKLAKIYAEAEPDAQREAAEAEAAIVRSPHQQFMHELTTSGKSLAEIQTAWHEYYTKLPDDQKHQVWQEFYDANGSGNFYQPPATKPKAVKASGGIVVAEHDKPTEKDRAERIAEVRQPSEIRKRIRHHVEKRTAKLSKAQKQNLHSLMFGLTTGLVVLVIFMFGFFNEVIIAPFIQPGRANATPVIVDNNSIAASGRSEVIIPKINVEIPVIYDVPSNDEAVIQRNLEDGVVHYPSTEEPGQKGNVAIFGHSSNNIFNKGKYKFAFVLLHELREGDTFYLTYNKQVYGYSVISRKVVDPSEVTVLNDVPGETATATLITCDPPGTSKHRLVVTGRQISPDPIKNSASSKDDSQTASTEQLSGNGPSLWSRFWGWLF